MRFRLSIDTEDAAFALGPANLAPTLRALATRLEALGVVNIVAHEERVCDARGSTMGKWTWELDDGPDH